MVLMKRFQQEGSLELFDDRDSVELLLEMARFRGDRP